MIKFKKYINRIVKCINRIVKCQKILDKLALSDIIGTCFEKV